MLKRSEGQEQQSHLDERYFDNLKEKVLEPFLRIENFRGSDQGVKEDAFKPSDSTIREDVHFLMENPHRKHGYSRQGAREISISVIDNNLAGAFAGK